MILFDYLFIYLFVYLFYNYFVTRLSRNAPLSTSPDSAAKMRSIKDKDKVEDAAVADENCWELPIFEAAEDTGDNDVGDFADKTEADHFASVDNLATTP